MVSIVVRWNTKGYFFAGRAVPADNAHGSFLLFATSLPRPVSVGSAPGQYARLLSTVRYFPDPPGIVTAVNVVLWITSIKIRFQKQTVSVLPAGSLIRLQLPQAGSFFVLFLLTFSPEWAILVLIS